MKMNILFPSISLGNLALNQGLYVNLVNEFQKQGHAIYAISPIKDKNKNKTELCEENGIKIIRVKTNKFKSVSNIKKGVSYIKMVYQFYFYIKKYYWNIKFDLILAPSLPPEIGVIVKLIKKHFKCPFYLMQYDYTWPSSVGLGFFSGKSLICRYYKYVEKISFQQADYIGLPTKGNIKYLKKHYSYVPDSKIYLLPMYMDPFKINNECNNFRDKMNLNEKFLVVYGGSIGVTQRLDYVVELAKSCQTYDEIVFVIVGNGKFLNKMKIEKEENHLDNILLLSFMPQKEYLQLLSTCDVGLIVLNEKLGAPNFPSKTVSYFNVGIPIVASIDRVTDYGEFLDETNTGLWNYSGDNELFKNNILKLYKSKSLRIKMSNNQHDYYEKNMTTEKAYQNICFHISNK